MTGRREFLSRGGMAALGLPWLARGAPARNAAARDARRPNVLFIMTDQQHAGMMSCTGNAWLNTPAMDRLAASGIRFERAYACNPVCVPNRFSLQTGHMPSAVGMSQNNSKIAVPVNMTEQSLGMLFRNAGYETVYGGKVHLPGNLTAAIRKSGYRFLKGGARQGLADACVEYLRTPHDKPFFLFASFINPHDICYMAIDDFRRSSGQTPHGNLDSKTCEHELDRARQGGDLAAFVREHCPPLPENVEVPAGEPECITQKYLKGRKFRLYARQKWSDDMWRLHRWLYCRLTEMVDRKVGQILDALEETGLVNNTLVVFTSDHGDMDGAHRLEHKTVLYEESVRVPYIMSLKGTIPGGQVDDSHLVSNGLDLLPTLCDYAGIEPPGGLHGRSVRALAERRSIMIPPWRGAVAAESQNGRMLRTDRFKYMVYDSGSNREMLIDLSNDPGEMTNLAGDAQFADALNEHRRLLCDWVARSGDRIGERYVVRPT